MLSVPADSGPTDDTERLAWRQQHCVIEHVQEHITQLQWEESSQAPMRIKHHIDQAPATCPIAHYRSTLLATQASNGSDRGFLFSLG